MKIHYYTAIVTLTSWLWMGGVALSQSVPQPFIALQGFVSGDPHPLNNSVGTMTNGVIYDSLFHRELGVTEPELIAYVSGPPYYKYKRQKVQQFDFLKLRYNRDFSYGKAIYILSGGQSVGYCLMSNDKFFPNEPGYNQIKSLPMTPSYAYELLQYPSLVKFYTKDHGSYVERYALVKNSYKEMLMIDAFYPKTLENKMKKIMAKNINHMLKMEAKRKNLTLPPPPPTGDPDAEFEQDDDD